MKKTKILISTTSFAEDEPALLRQLAEAGCECVLNPHRRRLTEEEVRSLLVEGGYEGLMAGLEPLTKRVLESAKALRVISRVGVGLDNVDQAAARALKIKVFNTPGVLTDAVAELTLGLMFSALRKIASADRGIRAGQWNKQMGALLKGKTVGIVGFGNIGQRVAELVSAFGAAVVFTDLRKVSKAGAEQVTAEQLFKVADIVSLHSAGKDCLIGAKEIQAMKPGVILVNTARGTLIDEAALAEGLASGKVACAALDVFGEEPYKGALARQENTVLTPHVGSYAREARIEMEKQAVENLLKGLGE